MTDRELIHKISGRDQASFKILVDRYQDLVLNTCYRFLGNKQDAEDVAQEVFLQVYKSISEFRAEAKLSSWIYRIAVNRSLNFIRNQKRFRWLKSLSSIGNNPADKILTAEQPDTEFELKERNLLLNKAIAALPEKQRVAFVLHKYEGLSYQEISEVMQRSLSSVEGLIHRAKLNLQKKLIKTLKQK